MITAKCKTVGQSGDQKARKFVIESNVSYID